MMNINVVCAGRLKEAYWNAACEEYLKRLTRYARVTLKQVEDQSEPRSENAAALKAVTDAEAARMLKLISPREHVIALCIQGEEVDSVQFAQRLSLASQSGAVCFLIGGSNGLGEAALRRADERISFSKMTFPHQLFRVMLLEQLYRACTINAGVKYHK